MGSVSSAEYAALAHHVYRDGHTGRCLRWDRYDFRRGAGDSQGLFCAVYVTPRTRMMVFAIRGTDDGVDLRTDAQLVAGRSPWGDFHSALGFFDMYRRHLGTWVSEVSVCGHSLGGALACMIGIARGVPAVTFNRPASQLSARDVATLRAVGWNAVPLDRLVVNFRNRGDLVSGALPGAVGRQVEVVKELNLRRLARGAMSLSDGVHHSMQTLMEAITMHPNAQLTPFEWADRR
jgi:pimeloyl-ACP methyl ester carboxylesterase